MGVWKIIGDLNTFVRDGMREIRRKLGELVSLILLLLGIIIMIGISVLAYNEIPSLTISNAIQLGSVLILAFITLHYAYQTHRLAETNQKMMERGMKEYLLRTIQPIIEEFESKRKIFRKRQYNWNWNKEGEENLHIDMPDEINHTLEPLFNDSQLKSSEFKECCEYCEKEYQPRSKELITQLKQLVSYTDDYLKEKGCYDWFFEIVYTEEDGGHFINRHDGRPVDRRMSGYTLYKEENRRLCNGDIRYFVVRKMIIDHIDNDDERQKLIEDLESGFPYGNMETVVYNKIDEIIKVVSIDNNDLVKQIDKLSEKLKFHAKHLEDELKKITDKLNEKYYISPVRYNKK